MFTHAQHNKMQSSWLALVGHMDAWHSTSVVPNQQRTLRKLSIELLCRNFVKKCQLNIPELIFQSDSISLQYIF